MGALASWLSGPELVCETCGAAFTNPDSQYAGIRHCEFGHSFWKPGVRGQSGVFVGNSWAAPRQN